MCRVLLVDDNEGIRVALGIALTRRGHQVDLAAGPIQALSKLAHGSYDWAVLDERMPRMTGTQLAAEIQRLRLSTRVVLMSSYEPPDGAKLAGNGVSQFLEKPFEIDELCSILAERTADSHEYEVAHS